VKSHGSFFRLPDYVRNPEQGVKKVTSKKDKKTSGGEETVINVTGGVERIQF